MSRRTSGPILRQGFLLLMVLAMGGPVLYTLLTSLKTFRDITSGSLLSFTPTLVNYQELFSGSRSNFTRLTLNSLITACGSTIIVLVVGALAAYSLSRFRWRRLWSGLVLGWLLFVHMLPPVIFVGPFYLISRSLAIYDTPLAVIMAHVLLNLPLAIWMMQSFFAEVPKEIEEAAAIDGCSRIRTFWQITLPITKAGLAATAVLAFVFSWKEFLFALSLTSTSASMTIPVGIAGFAQEYQIRYGEMAAAAFFATLPGLIFMILAQRHIIKGLTLGALKG